MFNYHLSKMRDTGVLDKIELKWLSPGKPQPPENLNEVAEALGGPQVFLPFTILLMGIGASATFILLEKISSRIRNSLCKVFSSDRSLDLSNGSEPVVLQPRMPGGPRSSAVPQITAD